jgi:hypothetical protein
MKKFMALYMAERAAIDQMMKGTPEQMKAGMDAWMSWYKTNEKAVAELGAPLGKTKRIDQNGAADAKNGITGYTIVEGDCSIRFEAFTGHPHLRCRAARSSFRSCPSPACDVVARSACPVGDRRGRVGTLRFATLRNSKLHRIVRREAPPTSGSDAGRALRLLEPSRLRLGSACTSP